MGATIIRSIFLLNKMSCGPSCGTGCGSSVCDSPQESSLKELIRDAMLNWSIPLDEEEANKWDLIFNVPFEI